MNLSPRVVLCASAVLLAFGLGESNPAEAGQARTAGRPNVVLIVADYLGYSDVGPYGAEDIRTPSIDRLASEGVRLTEFYAAAPICSLSRAALLTGRYPQRVGIYTNVSVDAEDGRHQGLSTAVPSLPRWLHDAGYATAHVGKWHLGMGEHGPNAHGFDRFLGFHTWTIGYHDHRTPSGEPGLYADESVVERPGYVTDVFTDEALDFIAESRNSPFFLYLAYNTGLPPYQGPSLPRERWGEGWNAWESSRSTLVEMVEAMDAGIGRVLDELDRRGLAENTIVVYTHDHGGRHLVNPGPLFHGFATLWEGGIRVPMIVRWPGGGIPAGAERGGAAISMDLTVTLLDAAGLSRETSELEGVDLLPLSRGEAAMAERSLYWIGPRNQQAIRRERFKYLLDDSSTGLLFDLEADIGERDNLFRHRPELAAELHTELQAWVEAMPKPASP